MKDVKVIMVMGYDNFKLLVKVVEVGVDGYFVKCIDFQLDLVEVVKFIYVGGVFLELSIFVNLFKVF